MPSAKADILRRLRDPGLIAIIRSDDAEPVEGAIRALLDGGISAIELTMTTPDALGILRAAARAHGDAALIGLGSVTDEETARRGIEAGARFIVTPVLRPEVIACCRRHDTVVAGGAYTPTEALQAHEAGADFVKIFPADTLGPGYIRAIRGPLPQLEIIPTGGVNLKTIGDFLAAGCAALAVGSNLVSKEVLRTRDWARLQADAAAYLAAVRAARG